MECAKLKPKVEIDCRWIVCYLLAAGNTGGNAKLVSFTMNCWSQNRVVLLTPTGRGALATILLQGPNCVAIADTYFRPSSRRPLAESETGRIRFGRWRFAADQSGEEVVVCRVAADSLEVNCHGGRAAAEAIIGSLVAKGCHQLTWRQWLHDSTDVPLAADARIALASATTRRTAAILLDQLQGRLQEALLEAANHLSAGKLQNALTQLGDTLQFADVGLHLTSPWRVVLAGRPNVGKSSLVNAILGFKRAIVFDQPGTTRDVVTAATALDGWPVLLADTAGLRDAGDVIEQAGVTRAQEALGGADLIVLVFDDSATVNDDDRALSEAFPQALIVFNKCDLHRANASRASALRTSALTGENIARLIDLIVQHIVPSVPPDGAPVPFTKDHVEAIKQAMLLASGGHLREAAERLRAFCGV